jgi:hypothetical protein
MAGIVTGLPEGQGGLFSGTVGPGVPSTLPAGWNRSLPRCRRSRCATRLYSTMLSNTTTAALVGYGYPGPTTATHALLAETEAPFDAFSVIVQNSTAAALTWGNLKVSSVSAVAGFNTKLVETLSGTFNGASTVAVAAGSATSPTFAVSDPIPLSSVEREDGGTRPLVLVTIETTTAADGSTQIGSWYRGAGDNASKTHEGGRVLACQTMPDSVAPADVTPALTNPDGTSAIVGFIYWARGVQVLTVMEGGNSLTAGNTLPTANRGHLIRAVEAASTPEAPIEYMVVGLPGQSVPVIAALVQKLLLQGTEYGGLRPGMLVFNPFDTNANVGGAIALGPMRAAAASMEALSSSMNTALALMEGLPRQASATASAWTNDAARRQFNQTLQTAYLVPSIPQARALQNSGDPALFAPGMVQADLTHPTKAGDDLIKDLLVSLFQKI